MSRQTIMKDLCNEIDGKSMTAVLLETFSDSQDTPVRRHDKFLHLAAALDRAHGSNGLASM